MIIEITYTDTNIQVKEDVVHIIEVAPFGLPNGILASVFTAKGQLIGASADSTPSIIPAPAADGLSLISDSSQASGWRVGTQSVDVADTTNHLINGGFDFAQRQAPGTDTTIANEKYGADRWRVTRENADLQYSRQDASSESGLTSRYYGKFTKITNAGKFALYQPLEFRDSLPLRGRSITFQVQMKASAAKTIKIAIVELQAAGTADSLPAAFVGAWNVDNTDPTLGTNLAVIDSVQSCSVTTSWQNFYVTGTIPADSKNLIAAIWTDADFSAADYLCLAEAGLYRGTSTQAWSPQQHSQELTLCQRYYSKSYASDQTPGSATVNGHCAMLAVATNLLRGHVYFPSEFRAAPTTTVYSYNGTINKASTSAGADIGTTVTAAGGQRNIPSASDSGSGFTPGGVYVFHWTAEAEL